MVPCGWFVSLVLMDRMTESLSMWPATWGRSSEIRMPDTFVESGLKPVFPFGSQLST